MSEAIQPLPEAENEAAKQHITALQPAVLEAIAAIVSDEQATVFGAEMAQAIANARATVDRAKGAQAVADGMNVAKAFGKPEPLAMEQQAEWFRCFMLQATGRQTKPREGMDEDGRIQQALTSGTDSAGGYLVPDEFVAEVEKKAAEPVVIWPLLRHRSTKRVSVTKPEITSYIAVNKGAAANMNAALTATEITETVPVWSDLTWTMRDFDARMPVKLDLIDESPIDVYAELIEMCADAYAIEREREPLIGTGSAASRPQGLLDSGAGITTFATGGADTVTEILRSVSQLPVRYRRGANIVLDTQTLFSMIGVLATNVRAAEFLVKYLPPILESEWMTEGTFLIGNFNYYVVYARYLMQIITGIVAERKTQEIVVTEKWDGQPTITDAFRIGTGVTYT